MLYQKIHLSQKFPNLGEDGKDPVLTTYILNNLSEMHWENRMHPCILICPGGGYERCSEREQEPIAMPFLAAGYHVFTLNYSVVPHRYPTQLIEVAASLEVIYANCELWHCDVSHVIIMGFSAGGHLAAHYSNSYDCKEVREVFPNSKPVYASVLGYPVITTKPLYTQGSTSNLLGPMDSIVEMRNRVSCENLVTIHTPPTFIWHTAADTCVAVQNSLLYGFALAEHHIPFALRIYPDGYHGLATADSQTCDILPDTVEPVSGWIQDAIIFLKNRMAED